MAATGYRTPASTGLVANKNVDLGFTAANAINGFEPSSGLPQRPAKRNATGRETNIRLNTYNVLNYPTKPVYMYDVTVGNGAEKKGTIKAMWESKAVEKALGPGWIFDGNKLAWSLKKMDRPEMRIDVDLNAEEGRGNSEANKKRVVVKYTKQVDFTVLRSWLERKTSFDNGVLEAINFIDHLMRETPSKTLVTMKRNFFKQQVKAEDRYELGLGVQAAKGVYASIRPALGADGKPGLSVNIDVANTTFWTPGPLIGAASILTKQPNPDALIRYLTSGPGGFNLMLLKPFRGINVEVSHMKDRSYKIKGFLNKNANTHSFIVTNRDTGATSTTTLAQYFKTHHNITLRHPGLPLVETTKPLTIDGRTTYIVLPMEVCSIRRDQRYALKLNELQTSAMIKFAATYPDERWKSIDLGLSFLNWPADKYLQNYGLQMAPNPTVVKARILPNPKIQFAKKAIEDPRTSGRWRLDGKVFERPHPTELKSYGVYIAYGRGAPKVADAQNFMKVFMDIFKKHGGKVSPAAVCPIVAGTQDLANSFDAAFKQTGNANKMRPQIMFVIVPDKNSQTYTRIKAMGECRFGIVSQVMQAQQIYKANGQYCSNLATKVNAKLGGITSSTIGQYNKFTKPVMIVGGDVSHGGPGTMMASIAAMTFSFDHQCIKYLAAVRTNGVRVEMITRNNIYNMMGPIVTKWKKQLTNDTRVPEHVIYFRDGVSEGQYSHVLNQELSDMRAVMKKIDPKSNVKFTVVIATKRHHVRFFPQAGTGDKNNNPLPGTLVETGVTHPFEYDFYLCSHAAIKGTARPVHYHVLLDEANMGVEQLQNMIYESSYCYVRSTTPISLPPAVYYAHLASNRGLAHIRNQNAASESGDSNTGNTRTAEETEPLMPMLNDVADTMWYV